VRIVAPSRVERGEIERRLGNRAEWLLESEGHRTTTGIAVVRWENGPRVAGELLRPVDPTVLLVPRRSVPAGDVSRAARVALLPHDATEVEIGLGLRGALAGLVVASPAVLIDLEAAALPLPDRPALTARELEVLGLVSDGLGNKRIAQRLGISPSTVKFHLQSVFLTLGVHSRAEAVSTGLRNGLLTL
jgi:DNA-binding NarL/FixJ family response regulator